MLQGCGTSSQLFCSTCTGRDRDREGKGKLLGTAGSLLCYLCLAGAVCRVMFSLLNGCSISWRQFSTPCLPGNTKSITHPIHVLPFGIDARGCLASRLLWYSGVHSDRKNLEIPRQK